MKEPPMIVKGLSMRGMIFRNFFPLLLKPKVGIFLGLLIFLLPLTVLAATFTAYGPETFVREKGRPITITRTFVVPDPTASYTIRLSIGSPVTNGTKKERNADGRENEEEKKAIVTAEISLNGKELFNEDDFRKKSAFLEKAVSLNLTNALKVKLKGKPGSRITITIIGVGNPPAVDNTPPTITATVSPLPNTVGWNNSDVTVSFSCSDVGSGIATCSLPVTVTAEGAGQIISGTATDRGGNSSSTSLMLNIDKTVPVISSTTTPSPNSAGWYNTNPVVSFTATDLLSGIASVSPPVTVTTEGQNQIITGTASDQAGNSATVTLSVNQDKTAPTVTIISPADGTQVTSSPVNITATVADSLSGVASVSCNNNPATLSSLTASCNQALISGANPIIVQVTDVAGNTTSATITVTLNTNHSPVSNPGGPYQGNTGSAILFDGSGSTDLDNDPLTFAWTFGDGGTGTGAAPSHTYATAGTFTVTLTVNDGRGGTDSAATTATIATPVTTGTGLPADPATVAPPLSKSTATSPLDAGSFLYTGTNPIQTGVAPGTITFQRAAVLRGRVLDNSAQPLPGVVITLLNHPEYGQTLSRSDGMFDLAVNGGGPLTIRYQKQGFPSVQRQINAPWQEYALAPDVILMPYDTNVTSIDFSSYCTSAGSCTQPGMQVARGSQMTDAGGTRQATLLFSPNLAAQMNLPGGTAISLSRFNVRATEYTVGPNGPKAMPADLPPSSGYTYAVELSLDEAVASGATSVTFSQPVITYIENFLGFPVGTGVPAGYYDQQKGQWIASANGRVIKVLSITGGLADLDTDGDTTADDTTKLLALGITTEERVHVAQLYAAGQTLWRVPVTHFTSWDFNWPYFAPDDATYPPDKTPKPPVKTEDEQCGSIIGCENQTLGEFVSISGTPWRLHYQSGRTPGYKAAYTLEIPVSGAAIPASLRGIRVEVNIAGRLYQAAFTPAPNLTYTVIWDGLDCYGRLLQGAQNAAVQVHYDYSPKYYTWGEVLSPGFARPAPSGFTADIIGGLRTLTYSKAWTEKVGAWGARAFGLGGWSPNIQHAYDPVSRILLLGDGRQRSADAMNSIITTVAGNGTGGFSGDGGPAVAATLNNPDHVAVGADGSLFFVDSGRIRRIGSDGIITTVAGNGYNISGSDIAMGADGSLYLVISNKVDRVGPNGIITTVAGGGPDGFGGDGGPATAAFLNGASGVVVGPDGSLFISDTINNRIRRVGTDGIITTFAGNGTFGFSGDGGPATAASLSAPTGVAAGADGSLYIADTSNDRVRRVGPNGIITTVAGKAYDGSCNGYFSCGDGGPAVAATLFTPASVAVDADGGLFISEAGSVTTRIRRVGPDGIITAVAGSPASYFSDINGTFNTDNGGFSGDNGPAVAARLRSYGIAVGPDHNLFIADTSNNRIRRVKPVLPGFEVSDMLLPSDDGSEVYVFNHVGLHLKTLDALTGALRNQFGYDASGYLTSITDGNGNVTTIERTGVSPTAIVAPGSQRTALSVGTGDWLLGVINPANEAHMLSYSADGLLQTFTDPRGNINRFTYDTLGRLIKDEDPVGGSTSLSRAFQSNGYSVTTTSALGRNHVYQVEQLSTGAVLRTVTDASGTQAVTLINTDGSEQNTYADGSSSAVTFGPDPRFGMLAPVAKNVIVKIPGGRTRTVTTTRTAMLADPTNVLSLTNLTDTVSDNGVVSVLVYNNSGSLRTLTTSTAAGRSDTVTLDALGRVTQAQALGLDPVSYSYDSRGLLNSITEGSGAASRITTLAYNAAYELTGVTDALARTRSMAYDSTGRLVTQTLPDASTITFAYDAAGNTTGLTPPGHSAHSFGYTSIDQTASYTPPDLGGGSTATQYSYDADRALTRITRPDGERVDVSYDSAGRISSLGIARGPLNYSYDATTGQLTGIMAPGGLGLNYSRAGALLTGVTWSGTVAGDTAYTYNNDLRMTAESVNTANSVSYGYDVDGLLSTAGNLTLTHNAQNGLRTGSTLGGVTDSLGYNTLGELTNYSASYTTSGLYSAAYTRDVLSRVTQKVETIGGTTTTYGYAYDTAGRLSTVTKDGSPLSSYSYDSNSNRTARTGPNVSASYDAQDRLTSYGGTTHSYTANGELLSQTAGTRTTSYQYDALGNLLKVTLPNGTVIDYLIDGRNRRIGKSVNGVLMQGFLYQGSLRPVAELDGGNAVVSRFVYATHVNVPDYMIKGGVTYRIVTDQLGSPRLVVDVATGAIAQQIDYDEFGQVLNDTNPGFQPFGFSGGLYDRDTKLVRFGARDYDAETGRWTAKDPIRFGGGDTNLYAYVANDPVNFVDPAGKNPIEWLKEKIKGKVAEKGKEGLCADGVCLGKDGKPQISVSGEGSLDVNGQKVVQAQGEACLGVKTDGSAKDKLFEYSVKVKLKILKYIDKDVVDLHGDLGKGDDLYKGPNNPTASPNSSQINKSNNYDPNSGEILE